jgi:translocation and assembly module TamB
MSLSGTDSAPALSFTSSPALSTEEIILLVMAGETPRGQSAPDQRAAKLGAYLGQTLLSQLLGNPDASERLSLVVGERVSRQGRETYGLEYALSPSWSLTAAYDEFDDFNANLKYHLRPKKTGEKSEIKN